MNTFVEKDPPYFIADTHFSHHNIIRYCNRPFSNVDEMNKYMLAKWNETVKPSDKVFFVGDFSFGKRDGVSFDQYAKLVWDNLNGQKIFIRGNHDKKIKSIPIINNARIVYKDIDIFACHHPFLEEPELVKIFGHTHNSVPNSEFAKSNSFCVSVELHDYKPVRLDKILEQLGK